MTSANGLYEVCQKSGNQPPDSFFCEGALPRDLTIHCTSIYFDFLTNFAPSSSDNTVHFSPGSVEKDI